MQPIKTTVSNFDLKVRLNCNQALVAADNPIIDHREVVCDAYCKNDPPDASQNLGRYPQPAENGQLKTPQIIKRPTRITCVTNPGAPEAQIVKTTLHLRLPISTPLHNLHKQRILKRHE